MVHRWQTQFWLVMVLTGGFVAAEPGWGQPVPDETLGAENSRVRRATVRGREADLIEGGATRGSNLFHSFREFGVREGDAAYFANPAAIENIFSRVTGSNPSNILGVLGVDGAANLFFMNPNGILFGPNASLDVQGSFLGTTANAIQFGELGSFSATNPETPSSLLRVNPSAFLFSQINAAPIQAVGTTPENRATTATLRVPIGQNLMLLGGDVVLSNSQLIALGGRIEIGAVRGVGTVEINEDGSLKFLETLELADVYFNNGSAANVRFNNGGNISITARNISLTEESSLAAGLSFGTANSQAGNITLNAIGSATVSDSSVANLALSAGRAGDVVVNAQEVRVLDGNINSFTLNQGKSGNVIVNAQEVQVSSGVIGTATFGIGDSGDTSITTRRLTIDNGGYVSASAFDGSSGRGGNLTIIASEQIEATGIELSAGQRFISGITAETTGTGDAGTLQITTRRLLLQDGASIKTETSNSGRGGDLIIHASESVEVVGGAGRGFASSISSETDGGTGNAGNLTIYTPQLSVQDGAVISSSIRNGSRGAGGDLTIEADRIDVFGTRVDTTDFVSSIVSSALSFNEQAAGNIVVNTRQLSLRDGGRISTGTAGAGNAGSLEVSASEFIEIVGMSPNEQAPSSLSTAVIPSNSIASGRGGTLSVETNRLSVRDGGTIFTSTFSQGNAGDLSIQATESIELTGSSEIIGFPSSLDTATFGSGAAGNLRLNTRQLRITNGAAISTGTYDEGPGNNLFLQADSIELNAGSISSSTFGSGRAGDLTLRTGRLSIQDGASIAASTTGSSGRAGDITVNADAIEVAGASSGLVSGIISQSEVNPTTRVVATGDAGNVTVTARTLSLQGGGTISTNTAGQGRGGNLQVTATESAELSGTATLANNQVFRSRLFTGTFGSGRAGDLTLRTGRLSIQDGASIAASTTGSSGRAGDITVNADAIEVAGASSGLVSGIISQSEVNPTTRVAATGDAGNVTVTARTLSLQGGGTISTNTAGQGRGGNLQVTATESAELSGTAILADNQVFSSGLLTGTFGSGRAGDLQITTNELRIRDGAGAQASTSGAGRAGNVRVEADIIRLSGTSSTQPRLQQFTSGVSSETLSQSNDAGNAGNIYILARRLSISDRAVISTATRGQGDAGNITVQSQEAITLNNGNITSSITPGSVGNGGGITIRTRSLLSDGGQIASVVSRQSIDAQGNPLPGGRGEGGDIRVTATDRIALTGTTRDGFSGGILTLSERGANGSAGNIIIRAGDIRVADGAVIVASTFNSGNGGNIEISADNFEAVNGGQVVTNTRDRGRAGRIELNITDEISLAGFDPNFQRRRERARRYTQLPNVTDQIRDVIVNQGAASGIFVNTERNSTGNSGTIILSADNLEIRDRAQISAQSQGTGAAGGVTIRAREAVTLNNRARISTQSQGENAPAGDIQIEAANTFTATDSDVTTSAANASGGDIRLTTGDVRLFGDSDIRTNSARDGGNISVNADTVVALDDSDIFASAAQGRGGDITLNTPAFFGDNYQPEESGTAEVSELDNNNRVDLNATGTVSSGTISTPDTSFIQNSLSDLTENVVDTDSLIANSCIARNETGGTFLITGSGGLPAAPGSHAAVSYPTGTIRVVPAVGESEEEGWQPGDAIVEPQGVYRLPDGRLVLSRECD